MAAGLRAGNARSALIVVSTQMQRNLSSVEPTAVAFRRVFRCRGLRRVTTVARSSSSLRWYLITLCLCCIILTKRFGAEHAPFSLHGSCILTTGTMFAVFRTDHCYSPRWVDKVTALRWRSQQVISSGQQTARPSTGLILIIISSGCARGTGDWRLTSDHADKTVRGVSAVFGPVMVMSSYDRKSPCNCGGMALEDAAGNFGGRKTH